MNLFQRINPVWIIHIFALLHMTTALCCRLAGVDDELLLTMLTMAMTLIVCMKKNLSIEFTASMIIVGNILGYLLGTLGANLMGLAMSSPYLIQPLSTFITTESLGWSIVAIAGIFKLGKSAVKILVGEGKPAADVKFIRAEKYACAVFLHTPVAVSRDLLYYRAAFLG